MGLPSCASEVVQESRYELECLDQSGNGLKPQAEVCDRIEHGGETSQIGVETVSPGVSPATQTALLVRKFQTIVAMSSLSERNRTIALLGSIAIVLLVLAAAAYALIDGRSVASFLAPLLGFATPTIVTLMTAAGVRQESAAIRSEIGQVHEQVNGNFSKLSEHNRELTDQLAARVPTDTGAPTHTAYQGSHRKDTTMHSPRLDFSAAPDITFTAADPAAVDDDRVVSGLALPFGEVGTASRGRVTAARGAVSIPPDLKRVKLLSGHTGTDGNQPVGYALSAEEKDDGIHMSFRIANTPAGDAALAEIREGVRDALSVELHDAKVSGTGMLQASNLTAVALVPTPAFASARVLNASLMGTAHTVTGAGTGTPQSGNDHARVDQSVRFGRQPEPMNFEKYVENVMLMRTDPHNPDLHAALADITVGGQPFVQAPPTYIGELWSGLQYQRRIVPLMASGRLTSMKISGWKWVTKPEVDDYAGDKAAIPTNPVATEEAFADAKRLAGGHDIDRAYFDFPDTSGFLAAYFRAAAEDYAYKTDQRAAQFLIANATVDATAQPDLIHAAAKARQNIVIGSRGAEPSYYLVNPADMFALLDVTTLDNPAYLELIGVKPDRFVPSELVPAGSVIAGARAAATFYELPGSPIRVQAEHIAQGGRDAALFGYYATLLQDARGLVSVPFGAPAGV